MDDGEAPRLRQLTDSITIDAPPNRVWAWLQELADHYIEWHPDHVSAYWVNGEPNQVGSVLEAIEHLGSHTERLRFEMTAVEPDRLMEYRILGAEGLLLPRGRFDIAPDNGGSTFTASITYRFGRVTESIFRGRVDALRAHMREEGENLKRLVETAG